MTRALGRESAAAGKTSTPAVLEGLGGRTQRCPTGLIARPIGARTEVLERLGPTTRSPARRRLETYRHRIGSVYCSRSSDDKDFRLNTGCLAHLSPFARCRQPNGVRLRNQDARRVIRTQANGVKNRRRASPINRRELRPGGLCRLADARATVPLVEVGSKLPRFSRQEGTSAGETVTAPAFQPVQSGSAGTLGPLRQAAKMA